MMAFFRYILRFFRRKKTDNTSEGDFYIPDEEVAGSIIFSYTENGDFNVVVSPKNISLDCAEVAGTLLFLLNSGGLAEFFGQSYKSWAGDDEDRALFMATLFSEWVASEKIARKIDTELAVEPSDVFNFKGASNDS